MKNLKDHRGSSIEKILENVDYGASIEIVTEPCLINVEQSSMGTTEDGWIRTTITVELDIALKVS